MAEGKKSFILYTDLIHMVEALPDEKAGQLFKLILEYVNDKNPETDDILLRVAFEPIRQQLKRDLTEWEEKKRRRKEAGHKGGIISAESRKSEHEPVTEQIQALPSIAKHCQAKPSNASNFQALPSIGKQSQANQAVNVNGTVTVNDTVNVNVIERENIRAREELEEIRHPIETCLEISLKDHRWVKASKATKDLLVLFNTYLETRGEYQKNPLDYKKHFVNLREKKPDLFTKKLSVEDYHRLAREYDDMIQKQAI